MKLSKRLASLLLILCMVFSMLPAVALTASAATETATLSFTGGSGTSQTSWTFNDATSGVSAIFAKASGSNSPRLDSGLIRFYTDNTLTVSAPSGATITGITFTMNGTYNMNNVSVNTGKIASNAWSGPAEPVESVVFTAGAQTRIVSATVTYEPAGGGATLTSISAGSDNTELMVGDTFVPATITGTYSDGSTADVTKDCTFTGYNMSAVGTYTISVTHTPSGLTTSYEISVTEPTTYTVTYHSDGGTTTTATVVEGSSIGTLPSVTAPEGWAFIGWSVTEIPTAQDNAPALYAGTEAVHADLDLYAVYAVAGEGGDTFKLLLDGTYVAPRTGTNTYLNTTTNEADAAEMGYDVVDGKAYLYYLDGTTKVYIYNNGDDTSLSFSSGSIPTGTTGYEYWIVTESDGTITFKNGTGARYLAQNNTRFSTYKPTATQYPYEFTKIGGTSYTGYTTNPSGAPVQSYTLTYDANTTDTVTGMPAEAKVREGETYTLSTNVPVREGYNFVGWALTAGSTETVTQVTMNNDLTVYAVWQAKQKYTVKFYTSDSAFESKTFTQGDVIAASDYSEPTAEAPFSFVGWYGTTYNDPAKPTMVTPAGTTVNSDLEFHAVYAEAGEGGSGEPSAEYAAGDTGDYVIAALYNGKYYALPNQPTVNSGKVTGQVITTATTSGGIVYVPSADAEGFIWTIADAANGQTISDGSKYIFHSNGGSSGTSLAYGTSTQYTWKIESEPNGLTFKGMSGSTVGSRGMLFNTSTSQFGGYALSNEDATGYSRIVVLPIGSTGTMLYTTNPVTTKITATWMNDADVFAKTNVAYGDTITAPAGKPERAATETEYYTFLGWSETVNGTVINDFGTAEEGKNKTYHAVYDAHPFCTVSWVVEGETVLTQKYKVGEMPVYPNTDPTKPSADGIGYTFTGWTPAITAIAEGETARTYTAQFDSHELVYTASLSLNNNSVKVGRSAKATGKLMLDTEVITGYTPVYTSSNPAVATVDVNGSIAAVSVGTTEITVTYTVGDKTYTATQVLTVVENTNLGGYTLMTKQNMPETNDWSGEYIFVARDGGKLEHLNDLWILTPKWTDDGASVESDTANAAKNASRIGSGSLDTSTDEVTASINSAYTSGDQITMAITGDNDFDVDGTTYRIFDQITEIPDGYAFVIELVDDVNMYYTIRIKGTSYYLANENTELSGNNGMDYAFTLADGDLKPLWKIRWATNADGLDSMTNGYTPDQILLESVYGNNAATPVSRCILFNNISQGTHASNARFRVYGEKAYDSAYLGASPDSGTGICYNLFLYGNPNPFRAQINYNGDQVTLTQHADVQVGIPAITLDGALLPDIATEPNWSLTSGPSWRIVTANTSGTMAIDPATGEMTFNGVSANDYAIVELTYVVHDDINKVDHTVSTQGMVVIVPTSDTYIGVTFERESGNEAEVSYTVSQKTTALPLDFYVKSDKDLTTVYNDGRISTGTFPLDNANAIWTAAISSGGGKSASVNCTKNVNGAATLTMNNFTEDAVITVTVSGVVANGKTVPDFTYKVYVKYAAYAAEITHDDGVTGDYTIPYGTAAELLDKLVKNAAGELPGTTYTLSTTNAIWSVDAASNASIHKNPDGTATLDASNCAPGTVITVRLSGMTATTNPGEGETAITTTVPATSIKITVGAAGMMDDSYVLDFGLPLHFDPRENDGTSDPIVGISAAQDGTFGTTVSFDWGTAVLAGNIVTVTPTKMLQSVATFYYKIGSDVGMIRLIPATNVYYEDSFGDGVFTFTPAERWSVEGETATDVEQAADLVGDSVSNVYGYDAAYDNYAMFSMNSAHKATVTNQSAATKKAYADFSFYGSGFDVYSVTGGDTGTIKVDITNRTGGNKVSYIIDTFYGYTYSEEEIPMYDLDGDPVYVYEYVGSGNGAYVIGDPMDPPADSIAVQKNNVYGYNGTEQVVYFVEAGAGNGDWTRHQKTTHWQVSSDDSSLYQIPVFKIRLSEAAAYDVKISVIYSKTYDHKDSGEYNFYFDAVRVYDPCGNDADANNAYAADKESNAHYLNIRDNLISNVESGSCEHPAEWISQWALKTPATFTTSETTNGRGRFVRVCTHCGHIMENAYFYVTAEASPATLDADEGQNANLTYKITWDEALNGYLPTNFEEYWSSSNEKVMNCKRNENIAYSNGAGTAYARLQLKGDDGVIYSRAIHTNDVTVTGCAHEYEVTSTVPATCTTDGAITYKCGICGREYVEVLEATGHTAGKTYAHDETNHWHVCTVCGEPCDTEAHTFEDVVTPPTAENQGYTTHTCTVCGYSFKDNYTDPISNFTATFTTPNGVTAPAPITTDGMLTLPTADDFTVGSTHYTFVGWVVAAVYNVTAAPPEVLTGVVPLTGDVTYKALYTYNVTSTSGTGEWKLVTDAASLSAGAQLVLAENTKGFVAGDFGTNTFMVKLPATFSSDKSTVTLPEGAVILTLGGTKGAWTLANADGQLLGAYAEKKTGWNVGTTTWNITVDASGKATVQNGTSEYGRFLYNVSSPRFTTYTSATNAGMLLPNLYMLDGGLTTTAYWTTEVEDVAAHAVADAPAMRSAVQPAANDATEGIYFIDGNANATLALYDDYGPTNEVYLAPGCAISFSAIFDANPASIQLGMKTITGSGAASITVSNNGKAKDFTITTATEMYYDLSGVISTAALSDGTFTTQAPIVITNTGENVISLTCLKWTTASATKGVVRTYLSQDDVAIALATVNEVLGNEIKLPDETPDEPETPATPSVSVDDFIDVDKTLWYYEGISYAVSEKLMNGVSDNRFNPDGELTRAMLVTILYRMAGEPENNVTETSFTDVPENLWYTDAVAWAVEKKITNGTTETTFSPDAPVTREQMVTFLWRYAGMPETEKGYGDTKPADLDQISSYAETAMAWAFEKEIVNGVGENLLAPQSHATRAQIATIFMRSQNVLAKQS